MSDVFKPIRDALTTTAANIRSLGPAGAIPEPYKVWLEVVDSAIEQSEEIEARLDDTDALSEQVARLQEPTPQLREILECCARIAFGDFTDLPRLKLIFNDANVYGPSPAQLELLLYRK